MGARGRKLPEEQLEKLKQKLTDTPQDVETVAAEMGTNVRTVYRWLKILEQRGANIVRFGTGGRGKFHILSHDRPVLMV